MKRVRITDNGDPRTGGTKVEAIDRHGVVIEDLSARCYGYDLSGRVGAERTATLFVYAAAEATADAEIVEVPRSLAERARKLAGRIGNPAVTAAFGELLGVSMKAEKPVDESIRLMNEIADKLGEL